MMEPGPSSAKSLTTVGKPEFIGKRKTDSTFYVWRFLVVQLAPVKFRGTCFRLATATSAKHTCRSNVGRDTVFNLDSQRDNMLFVNEVNNQHCITSTAWGFCALNEGHFFASCFNSCNFFGVICTCFFKKIPQDPKNWSFLFSGCISNLWNT